MSDPIPTSKDVVNFLNERFALRDLPYRLEHIAVLPYVNPMWMANLDVPQLADVPEKDIVDELVATFAPVTPESGINNNFTTATNKA